MKDKFISAVLGSGVLLLFGIIFLIDGFVENISSLKYIGGFFILFRELLNVYGGYYD